MMDIRKEAGPEDNLWRRAIEASAHAMLIGRANAPDFVVEYVNSAFEHTTGFSAADVIGQSARVLQRDDLDQPGLEHIRCALRGGYPADAVVRNYRADGTLLWIHMFVAPIRNAAGAVTHFVSSQYDVTHTKELEAQLQYQMTHDALTGLPNRILLRDRLTQALLAAARAAQPMWVIFVSLDRFKSVNDSLGHDGGDTFLKVIAGRLSKAVRACDTVARWGGDEFAVLMPGSADTLLVGTALERLLLAVGEVIPYKGQEYAVTCSIGVAAYPADAESVEGLLLCADTAAYSAKVDGHNRFRFHDSRATELALARLQVESQLRRALKQEEFVLHYQPQIELKTRRIIGVEALVRWQHPARGLLAPCEFIPVMEEIGLITALGEWVLRSACQQHRQWQLMGLPRMRMAVNLSACQFSSGDLVGTIGRVIGEVGMLAADLELELTESVVMENVDHGVEALRALKQLGVRIAIDDFGTGYSSLAYLKRFPIDVLKIDRSFVADIGNDDGDDAAIVASIIALAHTIKLKVIAEGVETPAQLNFLQLHGCDEIQGYLISKPVSAAVFEETLASIHVAAAAS
ncbi:MAG: EAL domain-containing protein [Pseudomonadota bacterium]